MSIITLTEFKAYNNIDVTDLDNDQFIQTCLDNAQNEIENYLDYEIISNTIDLKTFGTNTNLLKLPFIVPITINSITEEVGFNDISTIDSSDYYLYEIKGINTIKYDGILSSNYLYTINLDIGFVNVDSVPDNLKQILIEWSTILFKESNQKDESLGLASKSENIAGGSSTTTYKNILPNLKKRLLIYRNLIN